jgi:two-component system alkaline phosphatase synthesis response regulator PhoP
VLRVVLEERNEGAMAVHSIIVADDDAHIQEALKVRLEHEGYTVYVTADGALAWHAIRAHRPDLVILDLILPRMDGIQILHHLRSDSSTAHIPVIVLTGAGDGEREHCLDLGAVDFIIKPFSARRLLATIRRTLE